MPEKQEITEEDLVHEEWYKEARKVTPDTLNKFADHVLNDYEHDYGTIVHAVTALALAGGHVGSKAGGITGFQAGCVMWGFIRRWMHENNKLGLSLVDYDNLLYPQYESHFEHTITTRQQVALQEMAGELLESSPNAHENVREHWKKVADGWVPFEVWVKDDPADNITKEEVEAARKVMKKYEKEFKKSFKETPWSDVQEANAKLDELKKSQESPDGNPDNA